MLNEITEYELNALAGALYDRATAAELARLIFIRNYKFTKPEIEEDAKLVIDMWSNLASNFFELDIVSYKHRSKLSKPLWTSLTAYLGVGAVFAVEALTKHAEKLKLKARLDQFKLQFSEQDPAREDYVKLGVELSDPDSLVETTSFREDILTYITDCEDVMANKKNLIKTGIDELDKIITGVIDDDIVVVGGYSGSGKTHFLVQVANGVIKQGKYICFISNEMKKKDIGVRFVCSEAGISEKSTYVDKKSLHRFQETAEGMFGLHDEFLDIQYIDQFEKAMAYLGHQASLKKLDAIFIDYLQQFESSKKFKSEWEKLVYFCDTIRSFARKYSVTLFLAAQIGKEEVRSVNQNANLLKFHGAANIRNIASIGIVLRRDGEPDVNGKDKAELVIVKGRRGESGSVEGFYRYPDPKFQAKDPNVPEYNPYD